MPNIHGQASEGAAGPRPPPQNPSKPTNVDELLTELNRLPIFMTSLDETDGQGGSNVQLEALKALQYEGSKFEIANNFREQGNDCARQKNWQDAKEFYTQALDALRGQTNKPADSSAAKPDDGSLKQRLEEDAGPREVDWLDQADRDGDDSSKVVDLEEDDRKEKECEDICCANRALCHLELQNYGSAVRDCTRALAINPKNSKALYRSAQALLALDKTAPALSALAIGLRNAKRKNDKTSTASFEALLIKTEQKARHLEDALRQRTDRENRQRLEQLRLQQALKHRGIVVKRGEGQPPDLEDAKVALVDTTESQSELRTPVLLLYPTAGQSELVKEMRESATLGDLLAMILPVPFESSEFGGPDGAQVDCFVETGAGGLRKVGKRVEWRKVIENGGAVLRDGLITVHVLPKGKVEGWISEWKKRNGR
ncbi:MAG: hypothetical protein Q9159_003217 [Coniocarpon cinnabarinum]